MRRLFVVASARIAIEPVPRVVPVDFHLGMCGMNLLHFLGGNMRILLAEVQHHRRRRRLAGIVPNAASCLLYTSRMTLPTGSMVAGTFLTSDSKDQVVAFYKVRFGSEAAVMETSDGAILTLNKSKQDSVVLTITQKPNEFDGKTHIYIMHTIDNKAS